MKVSRRRLLGWMASAPLALVPAKVLWETAKAREKSRPESFDDRRNVVNPKPGYCYFWVRPERVGWYETRGFKRVSRCYSDSIDLLAITEEKYRKFRGYGG